MGKRAELSVSLKKNVCAYRDQFPVASEQIYRTTFPYYRTNPLVDAILVIYLVKRMSGDV